MPLCGSKVQLYDTEGSQLFRLCSPYNRLNPRERRNMHLSPGAAKTEYLLVATKAKRGSVKFWIQVIGI